jgi:outer membrane receptor protein involved in Fe transport
VQSLGREGLRETQASNLADLMNRKLGGVNVNEISGSLFQTDVTYRGFRASPILGTSQGISVYLDGVRINEAFGDVVNWDMVPEAALGSLLLVPGSNPLYGLNTLGGALALETRSGFTDPGVEVTLSGGSAGRRRADLAYGVNGTGGWHSFIGATLFDEGGWREHSEGHLGNVFIKAGRKSGATDWSMSLLAGRSHLLGNGLLPSYRVTDEGMQGGLYEDNRRAVYTFPDQTRNQLTQGTFHLNHRLGGGRELSALAYVRNSRRDTVGGDVNDDYGDYADDCQQGFAADGSAIDPRSCGVTRAEGAALHPASLNTTSTRQRGQGASVNLSARAGQHQIDAGATYDRSRVSFAQYEQDATFTLGREVVADPDSEREPSSSVTGTARTFGLYAADTWTLTPATHLTASARFNHSRVGNTLTNENGEQPPEAFTYTKINPAVGLTHDIGALTVYANVSQNNRVPTVIELGCADPEQPCRLPVGLQSDPYLKQVIARTVEAGVRGGSRTLAWSAALYRTANRDDILFLGAGASRAGYFANFSRTLHQGVDLSADMRRGSLTLHAGYNYLDATYDASGQLFTGARTVNIVPGTRIAGLPRHTLKLGLEWKVQPALTLGATLQAQSGLVTQGNEDGFAGEGERADLGIGGFAVLNLHASWHPAPGWELFARVGNALNRRYETYGAVATDMFPNGRLLQPHVEAEEPALARFVAPGAPRSLAAGVRWRF